MRVIVAILILFLHSCAEQRENLDYPKDVSEISEITLQRPDKKSNGKFAQIKKLTQKEIVQLLRSLENAKPIGPTKFVPDYYIIFTTRTSSTKRIKVIGNKIKGYDNDYSYEIEDIGFLMNF